MLQGIILWVCLLASSICFFLDSSSIGQRDSVQDGVHFMVRADNDWLLTGFLPR